MGMGLARSSLRLASADFLEFGYDVKKELEVLKKTIESINDVLFDADHKQDQVRVHDLLDDLAIEFRRDKLGAAEGKEVNRVLRSISSSNQLPSYNEMPDKIKEIRENFKGVVKEMKDLNLSPSSMLIAVVGLGGLGKTALAQLVYNDLEVQTFFDMQIWVFVSDNFDVKTILKKIFESITDGQRQDQSLEKLQRELRRSLSGKKYLLVLDDIWNESHKKWAELRKYLMCGVQDSKILVTTRSENVAKAMTASTSYLLEGLTDEASWSLLKNIAFGDGSKGVNQNLESMGKEIAKKCKGVPLAVKTLGGLLRGQNEESEWENVLRGDFWKLCEEEGSVMPILKLSYHNLSSDMRQCFAYCSLYPKDTEIPKDELIKSWMAQGYLNCSIEKQQMEDVGNQFVKMFLMNSFFQDAESNDDGEIISFKMHDLIHDLAILVSGNDCSYLDSNAEKVEGRPMHVSLESFEAIHLLKSLDQSRLRTLILPNDFFEDEEDLSVIAKFKYLRVLRMSSFSFYKLFDSIGKLKHLRYLDITSYHLLSGMPFRLGKLYSLQFLSIFAVGDSQERKYGTLNELKDLNLRGELIIQHLDRIIGNSLQLLENLEPHHSLKRLKVCCYPGMRFPDWLSLLTNVVDIHLSYLCNCRCLPPLERLPSLKSLVIEEFSELEYIYLCEDGFVVTFFPSLGSLTLENCPELMGWRIDLHAYFSKREGFKWYHNSAEPLKRTLNSSSSAAPLSMVKQLTISDHMNFPKGWMQNLTPLESLQIQWCKSETLEEVGTWFKDDTNCLPSLRKISISKCLGLKALPDWICNLSSLQEISLFLCPNLASLPERMSGLTNLKIF
ncbi:putative disease resistance protein RGA3 [Abrus precatorius]|uniref:Disease resistance protein RGA3 n=1 Tax=Abrus precatorius TaxID=3816 RepID=A0A8B8K1Z1_ABRPR|nr:putative disease resistance protein RGA3 [Abrus precatorius]